MSKPTPKTRFRFFERVATADPRMTIRQLGVVVSRPDDERGDSVNVLAFGGRFDALAEFLDAHCDRDIRAAVAETNFEVQRAQVLADQPVPAEPLIATA